MAKLTYWMAQSLDDSRVYNIRAKTKREATAMREDWGAAQYGPVVKVEAEYDGVFDLLEQCLGASRGHWEDDP